MEPLPPNCGGCRNIQWANESGMRRSWYGFASTWGLSDDEEDAANARFIAHAPEDIRRLLEENDRLRLRTADGPIAASGDGEGSRDCVRQGKTESGRSEWSPSPDDLCATTRDGGEPDV